VAFARSGARSKSGARGAAPPRYDPGNTPPGYNRRVPFNDGKRLPFESKRRRLLVAGIALVALSRTIARADNATTDPAVVRIRAFYDALLAVMQRAAQLGPQGRYDKLAPTIKETFDLAAMTRIAVGPAWASIPSEQQAALVEGFTRMTIATYASRFDGFSGERFEVSPTADVRTTGRVVRTRLLPASGEPVMLDYLMRGSGETWRVVDVYLTGTISELATRRSEFGSILKSGGPSALIESLREQTAKLMRPADPGKARSAG
jgi:phospholipid transport system substrate-binding protein